MLQKLTSWCNKSVLCAVIVLFIFIFYTGLLQELLRCLGLRS